MAHHPLILATASLTTYLGETAFRLCENYADAIVRAGGLPVVLPLTERSDVYDEYLDRADGLMLTGGADIEPLAIEARSSDVGSKRYQGNDWQAKRLPYATPRNSTSYSAQSSEGCRFSAYVAARRL